MKKKQIELVLTCLICTLLFGQNNTKEKCFETIYNDEMIHNIFGFRRFTAEIEEFCALFDKPIVDTFTRTYEEINGDLYTATYTELKTDNSYLKLQHNGGGVYIATARIEDVGFKFYKGLYIGINKDEFCKKIGINYTKCKEILVTNEEHTEDYLFIFDDMNTLKMFKSYSDID